MIIGAPPAINTNQTKRLPIGLGMAIAERTGPCCSRDEQGSNTRLPASAGCARARDGCLPSRAKSVYVLHLMEFTAMSRRARALKPV
jgi:hypothetical protein